MVEHGIPKVVAENAVRKLKSKSEIESHATIYNNVVDAAKNIKDAACKYSPALR